MGGAYRALNRASRSENRVSATARQICNLRRWPEGEWGCTIQTMKTGTARGRAVQVQEGTHLTWHCGPHRAAPAETPRVRAASKKIQVRLSVLNRVLVHCEMLLFEKVQGDAPVLRAPPAIARSPRPPPPLSKQARRETIKILHWARFAELS